MIDTNKEGFEFKNIERKGFEFKYTYDEHSIVYTKKNPIPNISKDIDVCYSSKENLIGIYSGDDETPFEDWKTLFYGRILNQEDFDKVLEMVII